MLHGELVGTNSPQARNLFIKGCSPLDCKEIHPVHSEGDQPWDFFGRNDANPGISLEGMMLKLKLQYFGHLMRRVDSLEGRDWGQKKGMTEDEMAGWHH